MILQFPNNPEHLQPGDVIRLGRFSNDDWTVEYGWYSYGGNRPVCGWYLTCDANKIIKPLQLPDLDDIVVIQRGRRQHG